MTALAGHLRLRKRTSLDGALAVLLASAVLLAGCSSAETSAECDATRACTSGKVCIAKRCVSACNADSDCSLAEICRAGVCVDEARDECETAESCTSPMGCHESEAVECIDGHCRYPASPIGTACDDGNQCTIADTCSGDGHCQGQPLTCNTPPAPTCDGSDANYVSFEQMGACSPATGSCDYASHTFVCNNCSEQCLGSCTGITCDDLRGGCRHSARCDPGPPSSCIYETAADGSDCVVEDSGTQGVCVEEFCVECQTLMDCPASPTGEPGCFDVSCDQGQCLYSPAAGRICGTPECSAGAFIDAASCDSLGSCEMPSASSCQGYQCTAAGDVCRGRCSGDSDCMPGFHCSEGDLCEANLCGSVTECTTPPSGEPQCYDASCTSGQCDYSVATGRDCTTPSCVNGIATSASTCTAVGVCASPVSTACGRYRCDAQNELCRTFCSTETDCATGSLCDPEGRCIPETGIVASIAAGSEHTCALSTSGRVYCWGRNTDGQCGVGTAVGDEPHEVGDGVKVVELPQGEVPNEIFVGMWASCARMASGSIYCWGDYEQVGNGLDETNHVGDHPGEMGDASTGVDLGQGRSSKALAMRSGFACAIRDDDTLACWGHSHSGNLGLSNTHTIGNEPDEVGDALPTIDFGTGLSPTKVALGGNTGCAILNDGGLKCWGDGARGVLGQGDQLDRGDDSGELGDQLGYVSLGSGIIEDIGVGYTFACALLSDSGNRRVNCWGYNVDGRLGLGDEINRGDDLGEMGSSLPSVDLGTGEAPVQITVGENHACALLDTGAIKCWGTNDHGQLGQGHTNALGDRLSEVGDGLPEVDLGGDPVVSVYAGNGNTCAVLEDGGLKCWGLNHYGQLGLGDLNNRGDESGEMGAALPRVQLGTGATALAVGMGGGLNSGHHVCVLLSVGSSRSIKCWGRNDRGQLGNGDVHVGDAPGEMGSLAPVDLGASAIAVAVSVGGRHSCAILDTGAMKCWGNNDFGALGLGDEQHRGERVGDMGDALPSVDLGTGRSAVTIVASARNTCAVRDDATVVCWGAGSSGICGGSKVGVGSGEMGDDLLPINIGSDVAVTELTGSSSHACVLTDVPDVRCWGKNNRGQLGLGHDTSIVAWAAPALVPADLGEAAAPIAISAAGAPMTALTHGASCAQLADGNWRCWGNNFSGMLGLELPATTNLGDTPGEMGDALPTVLLPASIVVTQLVVGALTTCALSAASEIYCWGSGANGILGLSSGATEAVGVAAGTMGEALRPVDLSANAKSISLGYTHACAVLQGDTFICWGANTHGQLGVDDVDSRGDDPGEINGLQVITLP